MRLRALLGGAALLTSVVAWHRTVGADDADRSAVGAPCGAGGTSDLCLAISSLSEALRNPEAPWNRGDVLPPPDTPGAVDPAVTPANIDTTICRPGHVRAAGPPDAITGAFEHRLIEAQHPGGRLDDYQLDHVVPIAIGGAPFDRRNLWLQSRRGPANAKDKKVLAHVLWRLVCEHRVALRTAQRAISRNWTQAYATYATPANIDKYPSGYGDDGRD